MTHPHRSVPFRTVIQCAAIILLAAASIAPAGVTKRTPGLADGDPWSAAALAPDSTELVLVLDDLATECDRPEAAALIAALESTGLVTETARAWRALAARLRLTPTEAVRALLGRRVLIAASGLARAGDDPSWVIASVIDRDTATRLRRTLAPVPRGVVAGVTELAIEDGAYRAAVIPEPGADAWILVLAPEGAGTMQAALVRALRSGETFTPSLAEPGGVASGLTEGAAVLAYRPRAVRATRGLETLAASIRRVPGGWRAAAAIDTANPIDHRAAGLPAVAAEDLLAECSLAFLGRVDADPAPGALDPSRWAGVLVGAVLEGVFTGLPEACGPEAGLLAVRRGADSAAARGELLVAARLEPACDAGDAARAAASRLWSGLSGTAAGGVGLETGEGRALVRLPTPSAGAAVFGPEAVVSWAGLGGADSRWSVLGVRSASGVGGEPWPTARRLFDADAPGERVVLAGVLHPGELAGVLGPGAGVLGGLGAWVDRVSWWAWGAQEGPRLVGRAELIVRTDASGARTAGAGVRTKGPVTGPPSP